MHFSGLCKGEILQLILLLVVLLLWINVSIHEYSVFRSNIHSFSPTTLVTSPQPPPAAVVGERLKNIHTHLCESSSGACRCVKGQGLCVGGVRASFIMLGGGLGFYSCHRDLCGWLWLLLSSPVHSWEGGIDTHTHTTHARHSGILYLMHFDRNTQTKHKDRQLKLPTHHWSFWTVVHACIKVKYTPTYKTNGLIIRFQLWISRTTGFS